MKTKGTVSDNLVMVMVDSGASHNFISHNFISHNFISHNFISRSMVQRLGLPIIDREVFVVKLGDGHQVTCSGMLDVILEISWMETLREKSQVSLKSLFKKNKVEFMGMMFIENKGDLVGTKILQPKFFVPRSLPPNREKDNTIPLLPELSRYHQIRMRAEDIPKTPFRTHHGHYDHHEYHLQAIFENVLVFFDGILIYNRCWQDHLLHVKMILDIRRQQLLFANKKKCNLGKISVGNLGHNISFEGVAMDKEKIKSMIQWPIP
ncbi:putative mitochondrial protein, partial [Mucuna pruriens]